MTNITIQDFHQDNAAAEEASKSGPVLITEDGRPKHVLMTVDEFRRMANKFLLTSTGETSKGTLADFIRELPTLPDELIDYDFPHMGREFQSAERD